MKEQIWGIFLAAAGKRVQLGLKLDQESRIRVPALGTPYLLELECTRKTERWLLSLTARKPELFHTTYLYRGSREEICAFLAVQTKAQWAERGGKLLREAEAIYFP